MFMTNLTGRVQFKLSLTLSGGYVSKPAGAALEYAVPELKDDAVRIILRDPSEEKSGPGNRITGYVLSERLVCDETEAFIRAFIDRRMIATADGVELPIIKHGKVIVGANGVFENGHTPRLENCPSSIQAMLKDLEAKLRNAASRFLHLLRWQQGVDFGSTIVSSSTLYWRVEEGFYHSVPTHSPARFKLGMSKGVEWAEDDKQEFSSLWCSGHQGEPLAHRLLRSAVPLVDESPEAAILVLATSLEAGIKLHVCYFEPGNQWLLKKGPSPSVISIFSEYLPALYKQKGCVVPSFEKLGNWRKDLKEIFDFRNNTAHRGDKPEPAKGFDHYFRSASDILYLLDVIEGHEWAKKRLSPEICKALDWPAPPPGYGSIEAEML